MMEIPGMIESWITIRSNHSVKSLLDAKASDTPVEIEVVDPEQLDGRSQLRIHMRGGVRGRWDGGTPDEPSWLNYAIETREDHELYRIYYLTNRFGESIGMIHSTEHGGKTPDDYRVARDQLQKILRKDTTERKWKPCLLEVPE